MYAFRLTEYLKAEIAKDPQGVLARQFLVSDEELKKDEQDLLDPIGDKAHSPCPGVVHRYPDRALLMVAVSCAAYCRYCFRKEVVGRTKPLTQSERLEALDYIASQPQVKEVILTGGDPLVLSNSKLNEVIHALLQIPHLRLIRMHTRAPITDPTRINEELVELLTKIGQKEDQSFYMVIHANHLEELTRPVREGLSKLRKAGITLLSQSVLLKGINDSVQSLEDLFRELTYLGVKPYYLHHLDRAPGSSHFRVSLEEGRQLVHELRGRLTGLAHPTYIIDIPGGFGKVPVTADYIQQTGPKEYLITDPQGKRHLYKDY